MAEQGENAFNEEKDRELVKVKVKIDAENWVVLRLLSYDGAEPKLEVTRWYLDRAGKWQQPRKQDARIRWRVLMAIWENASKLEDGYNAWRADNKERASATDGPPV